MKATRGLKTSLSHHERVFRVPVIALLAPGTQNTGVERSKRISLLTQLHASMHGHSRILGPSESARLLNIFDTLQAAASVPVQTFYL